MLEKLVVFGASNAAGLYGFSVPRYVASDIVSAVYTQEPCITKTPQELIIDLSNDPILEPINQVVNAGAPGDSILDMRARFQEDVIYESPSHVFIWPGLNDAGIATALLRNNFELVKDYPETAEAFSAAMEKHQGLDQKLTAVADVITANVSEMVQLLDQRGVKTLVGTIPPYSSRLAYCLEQGEPLAKSYQTEALPLIEKVNRQLRRSVGESNTVDVYNAVLDLTTGFMRQEFSWGEQKDQYGEQFGGDVLHLSDEGQIMTAVVLCSRLFNTPTRAITPSGRELAWR